MSLTKLTANLNTHQSLADDPSLTPSALKAKWDEAPNAIKTYVNETLTPEVDTLVAGLQSTDSNLQGQINTNKATLTSDQLNLIYPIGAIYMSVVSTNPGTLFGGTWEQIQNKFLVASGSSYSAGSTGGSATHTHTNPSTSYSGNTGSTTLTVNQIPSHSHSYTKADFNAQGRGWALGNGGTTQVYSTGISSANTGNTGGGQGHTHTMNHSHTIGNTGSASNLPPYLSVYMWKRTA